MMLKTKKFFKGRISNRPIEEHISIEKQEIRLEKKLIYVLHLLSVRASRKTRRKSLPSTEQMARSYSGIITTKTICQWEKEFINQAVKRILNEERQKIRLYVDINIIKEATLLFPRGEMKITLYYYVHH